MVSLSRLRDFPGIESHTICYKEINFRFTCGEWNVYWKVTGSNNVMTMVEISQKLSSISFLRYLVEANFRFFYIHFSFLVFVKSTHSHTNYSNDFQPQFIIDHLKEACCNSGSNSNVIASHYFSFELVAIAFVVCWKIDVAFFTRYFV